MLGFALRLSAAEGRIPRTSVVRLALLASAFALWLEPVWTTLRYGQIDLLIGALILFDLSLPDRSRRKGAGIGVAVAMKLTPAIFVLYLLLTRRLRAAAVAAVGLPRERRARLRADSRRLERLLGWRVPRTRSRVGRIENAANQSLRGAWSRLLHSMNVDAVWLSHAPCSSHSPASTSRCAPVGRGDDARGFSLCALTGLLVSPISWSHHWVLAVPALDAARDRCPAPALARRW